MAVLPDSRVDQIEFCEAHIDVWSAAPATIGLTAAQVAALSGLTEDARKDYLAAQTARDASKSATEKFYDSTRDMREKAAELIRVIKTFADTTNNPNVYQLAQIPQPAAPSVNPPPGKPTGITITLNASGAIALSWKSENASGGFFQVYRRIGTSTTGAFTNIGGTGNREFTDGTLPLGSTSVTYRIQGFRGQDPGESSDNVLVQFGVAGGAGGAGVTVEGATLQMAA